VCLVVLEIVLRIQQSVTEPKTETMIMAPAVKSSPFTPGQPPPVHITTKSPILYELNPNTYDINSQGLRDDEVAIPKPEGTLRILVLGDSVAFGPDVSRNMTFANRLERLLQSRYLSVEVLNAGVLGYTAYNELQFYLTKGRAFEPDIVIVAFCMNDIVNPRLHWGVYTNNQLIDIPDRAIPNLEHDRNIAIPKAGGARPNKAETPEEEESLLDRSSPEWQWLSSIYDELHDAVKADNAVLMIAVFPLAYQMEPGYPYFPPRTV
jgi:hypothetical protein